MTVKVVAFLLCAISLSSQVNAGCFYSKLCKSCSLPAPPPKCALPPPPPPKAPEPVPPCTLLPPPPPPPVPSFLVPQGYPVGQCCSCQKPIFAPAPAPVVVPAPAPVVPVQPVQPEPVVAAPSPAVPCSPLAPPLAPEVPSPAPAPSPVLTLSPAALQALLGNLVPSQLGTPCASCNCS
ncbi:proline-rich receptor-like protein kinase PERK2 [Sitophilus oryzae]|uniref:Proline-rich receptor-like protein kinase PERK2 n=1 Tax=Sitophilus oryzae TaxID=7048 RepID=A0A6J2YH05_SITOR|nr:proline-rich receptor-like protein kinase PERK2 [Sitophilus oryzae]